MGHRTECEGSKVLGLCRVGSCRVRFVFLLRARRGWWLSEADSDGLTVVGDGGPRRMRGGLSEMIGEMVGG